MPEPFALFRLNLFQAMTIPAKYENGVFRPLEAVQMKEGTVVEVHVPAEQKPVQQRRSIKDLPFFGMWKDRTDIGDGAEYVNRLRDNPRS
jgi:predicted DNA-binding antitoxin AbrB/MazE fold protein